MTEDEPGFGEAQRRLQVMSQTCSIAMGPLGICRMPRSRKLDYVRRGEPEEVSPPIQPRTDEPE